MKRLTTPTHEFCLEVDPTMWDSFRITYKQCGCIVLEKTEADNLNMESSDTNPEKYKIWYQLTQQETKMFKPGVKVEIQIRCHYPDGTVFASDIVGLNVSDVLNQEILGENED